MLEEFDSEEEARAAVEQFHVGDILNNSEITIYLDREAAEQFLRENQADL